MPTPTLRPPLWLSGLLLALSLSAGAFLRFALHAAPWGLQKYGGSFFWALAIYWTLWAFSPRRAWLLATLLTTAIELFKLVHTPALDHFRHTLAGILLLGRIFSLADIAVYGLAILAGALFARLLQRHLLCKTAVRQV